MANINIRFTGQNGNQSAASLPENFNREDFIRVVRELFSDWSRFRFIMNGRELALYDNVRFNEIKHKITNGCLIYACERMTGGCFLPHTLVLMADGTSRSIDAIRVGDELLAFTNTDKIVSSMVRQKFVHTVTEYVELFVGDELTTPVCVTHDHPFYVGKGQFAPLKYINDKKDTLFTCEVNGDGKSILTKKPIIGRKNVTVSSACVYNLSADYPNTFFANGIAVHNKLGDLGAAFVDVSNTSGLKRIQWSHTAPSWRIAKPGICLEGKCNNTNCIAVGQQVIMNIGLVSFDYLGDVNETTARCPCCSRYVEPITCAFNRCMWRWSGIKQPAPGEPPRQISADWKQADNAYHCFDEQISGTVIWRKLILEAKAH
ncbi:unnamed protein product [Rotaria magnacalcarata]|uniref:Hint domain-containing protein n=1 Tax=Rotaria magnacalcarata TaxID=392030 RepID=A0A817AET8_9BILA|nr:unnamed protein product [Rotaria magnacalcarata]CAF2241935.1 unnamed protein product [Rotaria magnacalcarata]CAF4071968.1 unnamed protein product [Rotaria magnacalcarata]